MLVKHDLDKWGRLYGLRKAENETDDEFRERLGAHFLPRVCTGELFEAAIVPEMEGFTIVKKWSFCYSDGDVEAVITRERVK